MGENDVGQAESEGNTMQIGLNAVVTFHYRLSELDSEGNRGEWREQSHGGQPLHYLHGFHNVVVGLEKALEGKKVGDAIEITLNPEEAYGLRQENATQRVPIKHLLLPPGTKKLVPGTLASVKTDKGNRNVIIIKSGKFNADVDFNHPLAGKRLYYEIEVVAIRDASVEEIAHGHVHGPGGHAHQATD